MFSVFGIDFKSKSELSRVLGYSKPISPQVLQNVYGGTWENLVRIRLKLKDSSDAVVQEALQTVCSEYEKQKARDMLHRFSKRFTLAQLTQDDNSAGAAAFGPEEQTLKAALRLAIEVIPSDVLKTAAITIGTAYTPEQLKAALKIYAEKFDFAAAAAALRHSAGEE